MPGTDVAFRWDQNPDPNLLAVVSFFRRAPTGDSLFLSCCFFWWGGCGTPNWGQRLVPSGRFFPLTFQKGKDVNPRSFGLNVAVNDAVCVWMVVANRYSLKLFVGPSMEVRMVSFRGPPKSSPARTEVVSSAW